MKKAFLLILIFLFSLNLVSAANCWFQVRDEPGISPEKMKIYYNNEYYDDGNLLVIGCKVQGENSWPEVAVLYSSGYLRLKPPRVPDNRFGSSFILGPGYWSDNIYYHNPQIKEVRLSSSKTSLKVSAENNDFLINYKITISPKTKRNTATITETITAKNNVQLDSSRINSLEAFKIVQISSMYINNNTNDANYISYNLNKLENKAYLKNENRFIFSQAVKLDKVLFNLINIADETWQSGWIAPSLSVSINKMKQAFLQGYIAYTLNPNNDNTGIWINDNSTSQIAAGTKRSYSYKLSAY